MGGLSTHENFIFRPYVERRRLEWEGGDWDTKCSVTSLFTLQEVTNLHQCSVCGPAVEILDEVHEFDPVNPLESPENPTAFKAQEEPCNSLFNTIKS